MGMSAQIRPKINSVAENKMNEAAERVGACARLLTAPSFILAGLLQTPGCWCSRQTHIAGEYITTRGHPCTARSLSTDYGLRPQTDVELVTYSPLTYL